MKMNNYQRRRRRIKRKHLTEAQKMIREELREELRRNESEKAK